MHIEVKANYEIEKKHSKDNDDMDNEDNGDDGDKNDETRHDNQERDEHDVTRQRDGIGEIVLLITEGNLHKIRTEGSADALRVFAEICFPALVGKQAWKVNHMQVIYRTFVTVADEALAILILENNYMEWIDIAKGFKINKQHRLTKYTHGGMDAKGTKKGWSLDGRMRFNSIYDAIKEARKQPGTKEMEEKLRDMWGGRDGNNGVRTGLIEGHEDAEPTDQQRLRLEEAFQPRYDFDD